MIITSNVIKSNFIVMFFTFLLYEIILMTCLVLLYNQQLKKVNTNIETEIIKNSNETMQSYNYLFNEELTYFNNDLQLIDKQLSILQQREGSLGIINPTSSFASSSDNCAVKGIGTLDDDQTYTRLFLNKLESNPIKTIITSKGYFAKDISVYKNDEIINILSTIPSLNNISALPDQTIDHSICLITIILKTILIKSIALNKNNAYLNNIFIFNENNLYVYPRNNLNQDYLNKFQVFQCGNTQQYSNCFHRELNIIFNENDITSVNIIDKEHFVWSCIKYTFTANALNSFICLQWDIASVMNKITKPNLQSSLASIKIIYSNTLNAINVCFSPNYSFSKEDMSYFTSSTFLKDELKKEPQLFHLIYYEIFKYKQNQLQEEEVMQLETEYETIIELICSNVQLSNSNTETTIKDISFRVQQTFLDYNYNIAGELDKVNGQLKVDDFIYYITPFKDVDYLYDNSKLINIKANDAKIAIKNIIIYKMIINTRHEKLYEILIYKCIRSWTFFAFLLLICSLPYLILFRFLLKQTFAPIEEIAKKMELKFTAVQLKKGSINQQQRNTKLTIDGYEGLNEEYKDFCQFFFFLENLLIMKQGNNNSNNLQIDESIMNKIYPYLQNNKPKITYGAYVARYFYQNQMHIECKSTIQNIKPILEEEINRMKEETDNIEVRLNNLFSKYPYINDFSSFDNIFNEESNSQTREYLDLCLISSQLYFIHGLSKYMAIYIPLKNDKRNLKRKGEERLLHINPNEEEKNKTTYNTNSSRKAKVLQEKQLKLKESSIKAIVYFKKSLEYNKKFNCNKIKSIILYIYISQCYITQSNYQEAYANLKEALVSFLEFNDEVIEMEQRHKIKFDSAIMIIINSLLFEEIIYSLSKILYHLKDNSNKQLVIRHLSQVMSLSLFKTDFVQAKVCKLLSKIIEGCLFSNDDNDNDNDNDSSNFDSKQDIYNKGEDKHRDKHQEKDKEKDKDIQLYSNDELQVIANQIQLMKKIETRLNESTALNLMRKIVIVISPSLVDKLPSIIEFGEILGSCIRNYCSSNDLIWCFQFNNYKQINALSASMFTKEHIYSVLSNKSDEVDFAMQQSLLMAIDIFKDKDNDELIGSDMDEDCIEDNYIFQFILSSDYKYESAAKRSQCKNEMNENNISLYTFVFDFNVAKGKKKQGIIFDNSKYFEGIVFVVKNFDIVKSAFQNISNKKAKKNLFNFDLDIAQNVFYFIHLLNKASSIK